MHTRLILRPSIRPIKSTSCIDSEGSSMKRVRRRPPENRAGHSKICQEAAIPCQICAPRTSRNPSSCEGFRQLFGADCPEAARVNPGACGGRIVREPGLKPASIPAAPTGPATGPPRRAWCTPDPWTQRPFRLDSTRVGAACFTPRRRILAGTRWQSDRKPVGQCPDIPQQEEMRPWLPARRSRR